MNNILNKNINVLGIETTCDETAAAIVSLNEKGESNLISNIVHSQYMSMQSLVVLSQKLLQDLILRIFHL